jgi:hypothetical protein
VRSLSIFERRLAAEWDLLLQLADRNRGRLSRMQVDGAVLSLHLHGPAAAPADPATQPRLVSVHAIRIEFPVHFPAVPMEMFLQTPVFHPNVHPETGFVCLWDRHRVSNTVEHALHKTVAMLAGELRNTNSIHVMQPEALEHPVRTEPMPLLGVTYDPLPSNDLGSPAVRRQRLQ